VGSGQACVFSEKQYQASLLLARNCRFFLSSVLVASWARVGARGTPIVQRFAPVINAERARLGAACHERRKQTGHPLPLFISLRNHHNSDAFSDYNRLQLVGCMWLDTALGAYGLRLNLSGTG